VEWLRLSKKPITANQKYNVTYSYHKPDI